MWKLNTGKSSLAWNRLNGLEYPAKRLYHIRQQHKQVYMVNMPIYP